MDNTITPQIIDPYRFTKTLATIDRVIDGDTIKVHLHITDSLRLIQTIRLARIDAPEMKTPEGIESKEFLMNLLPDVVTIEGRGKDRYGRIIGDITMFIDNQFINVSDFLLMNNRAKPYITTRKRKDVVEPL